MEEERLLQAISGMEYPSEAVTSGLDGERVTDRYAAAAFGWRTAVGMVADAIGRHGSDGWTYCGGEENLPEEPGDGLGDMDEFEEYIVMIEGAEVPTVLGYAGNGEWYRDGVFYSVIAWRPMPEPYRPRKSAGDDHKRQIIERFCRVE